MSLQQNGRTRWNAKDHYVSQFYLRHWADSQGMISAYPIDGRTPFPVSPRGVAFERGLYDHPKFPSSISMENVFFASVEGVTAPVWPDVVEFADSEHIRGEVAFLVALFFLRLPEQQLFVANTLRQMCSDVGKLPAETRLVFRRGDQAFEFSANDYLMNTKLDRLALKISFLDFLRTQAEVVGDVLAKRPWGLVCADEDVFLTSDFPVVFERAAATLTAIGLGTPGTEITFPLSPRRVLIISEVFHKPFGLYHVGDASFVNKSIVKGARRFVFGSRREESVQRNILMWRAELN